MEKKGGKRLCTFYSIEEVMYVYRPKNRIADQVSKGFGQWALQEYMLWRMNQWVCLDV